MRRYCRLHTFIGSIDTQAADGFAGFCLNQDYELRYLREDSGLVTIELDHLRGGGQLTLAAIQFEAWFIK